LITTRSSILAMILTTPPHARQMSMFNTPFQTLHPAHRCPAFILRSLLPFIGCVRSVFLHQICTTVANVETETEWSRTRTAHRQWFSWSRILFSSDDDLSFQTEASPEKGHEYQIVRVFGKDRSLLRMRRISEGMETGRADARPIDSCVFIIF